MLDEHDRRLKETLKLIEKSEIKLNPGRCEFCNGHCAVKPKETLKSTPLLDRPWQKVGTDILKLDSSIT